MFRRFERCAKAGARYVVRGDQMDRSFVVFEGAGGRIWDINLLAGLLLGVERRGARTVK
jgi:hypothetical protein